MQTMRMPEDVCLDCGRAVDATTGVSGRRKPRPGDITVCLYCGHLMAFDDELRHRALTDAEMVEIAGDPRLIALQRARAKVRQ